MTFLFHQIIFGPVKSRRLGVSLGINLLPTDGKVCTFDCIYCECGYNDQGSGSALPRREQVRRELNIKLRAMLEAGEAPDVITFAGNGEPTLHPEFAGVVDDTIELRDLYFPNAKISVLSNSTTVRKPEVFEALKKIDNNILKLDSAIDATVKLVDRPVQQNFTVKSLVEELKKFEGKLIIQTMFLRGMHKGQEVDNTTEEEVKAYIKVIKEINPKQIMVYSLDRDTPEKSLHKVSVKEMEHIADKLRAEGFSVVVSG
ncbi:radical SAM protein [Parabacteroides sp. FAFU027]|uniref:radical SAM protein n=1 Tax=Parabacteroides sp. FAFU027 TaxID=2922715 RepID=UPI001FAF186F|nr:radical SAM protein [Parabacteroides sp. FAFU027]